MESLLDFPDEILLKIFSFIPNCLTDYTSVCWKFYTLICDIDKFKYKMSIDSRRIEVSDNLKEESFCSVIVPQ